MTDDDIRLFNELMSTQPGEQIEGLASRYPSVFEVPSISKPDPNAEKLKQILEGREQLREKQRQEEFAARPLPEKIEGAREAAGFLGSTIGRGMTYPFVELYGRATDQPSLGSEYLEGAELPKTDLGLEYTIRTGEALEPLAEAMDVAKIPHTPFTPELLPLANMPFALSKLNVARAGQKAVEDVREAGKAASQVGRKAADIVEKGVETVQETLATPPVGAISLDALGFSSRLSEGVDKLQDKGTGPQFLAQLSKMKGVPQAEIKVTGLDEFLKKSPKVTKQEVQDYLETNRLQLIEDERFADSAARLSKEQKDSLPREFDWLDRHDLDGEFEDKAHLRNHLMVTLNRHFDDLELHAADQGYFYARDTAGEVRYIPASRRFEWLEAEQDRIDDVLSELPDFSGATNFPDQLQIPGGQNYREILYKLPRDKVEGVFRPPPLHYTNAENTFGTIRSTDRDIDGTPVLFAEEIQSDWAIAGAQKGYRTKDEPIKGKVVKQEDVPGGLLSWKVQWDDGTFSGGYDKETAEEVAQLGKRTPGVPDNPFRGNWYKPVINNFLVKAAQEGKGGIGFPVGEVIKDRYDLSTAVESIKWDTYLNEAGKKSKTVLFRNVGDKGVIEADFDPETGVITEISSDLYVTPDWKGKKITDVVGKGVAEKLAGEEAGLLDQEGLKIGGRGKDKLYDEMLPKHLNEIGKRYGVQLEKRTIPFGEGDKTESEVYFMPITEEMRNDILSEGLPMFKQGGHVQKFAPGGKVMKGIAKGAKEASKAVSRQERVDKNLAKFLGKTKEKDRMYHATHADIESFRPSHRGAYFVTPDRDFANEHIIRRDYYDYDDPDAFAEGANIIPVYVNAENPFDYERLQDLKNLFRRTKQEGLDLDPEWKRMIMGGDWSAIENEKIQRAIKNLNHDSFYVSERMSDGEPIKNLGVFKPTQIKSALGNRGSFDLSDPDITKAKGGPIKSALEGVGKAAAEVKKNGKLTRLQKELLERGGEKQAQRLERAADEIPGLERLFHTRGLIEAFQGSEGYPYQGVVTMRPGDYKNWAQPLEIDLADGRRGISPYSVQNIEDLRELIQRGRPFTSVPYLQLDKKGPLTMISGHEGRHRTRAMEAEDIPATLVQVLPRHSLKFKDLRNPSPSEWRQKLSEAMGPEGLVLPESGMKPNPKFVRASELAKKAGAEQDWDKVNAINRELSRYYNEDKVKLPDLEMLTEFPEVYQKGGAVKSMVSGAQRAAKEGQKMLQGVYRGYTGERLEEPVLSTTPQRKVAEYYATRRAATRGEDPHVEMLMIDPFVGKEYGLALPIDEFNRELLTTRARAIAPSDVVERIQLKKKGGLACLSK